MTIAAIVIFVLFVVKVIIHLVQTPAATNAIGITNAPIKPYKQSKLSKIMGAFWPAFWLLGAVGFLLDTPLRYYDVFMALFLFAAAIFSGQLWYKPKRESVQLTDQRYIVHCMGITQPIVASTFAVKDTHLFFMNAGGDVAGYFNLDIVEKWYSEANPSLVHTPTSMAKKP